MRSLEPIENPSKRSANSAAWITFEGTSAITYTCSPASPLRSPSSAMTSSTLSASVTVRQNGIMASTFSNPISSRTLRRARHSSAKPAR